MTTPNEQMGSSNLRSEIRAFLAAHSTLTLATVSADGQPMAASLFFAEDDDLNLYWVSSPKSRHSLNLSPNPRAAVTVHNATWTWTEIAGVQMEGGVRPLPLRAEAEKAWEVYRAKFAFADEFQAEVARSTFYRFTPRWARLIDNARGFGHKAEITLP
jgi:hypothetical protein